MDNETAEILLVMLVLIVIAGLVWFVFEQPTVKTPGSIEGRPFWTG